MAISRLGHGCISASQLAKALLVLGGSLNLTAAVLGTAFFKKNPLTVENVYPEPAGPGGGTTLHPARVLKNFSTTSASISVSAHAQASSHNCLVGRHSVSACQKRRRGARSQRARWRLWSRAAQAQLRVSIQPSPRRIAKQARPPRSELGSQMPRRSFQTNDRCRLRLIMRPYWCARYLQLWSCQYRSQRNAQPPLTIAQETSPESGDTHQAAVRLPTPSPTDTQRMAGPVTST